RRDLERDLRRLIGEVAGVAAQPAEQAHRLRPSLAPRDVVQGGLAADAAGLRAPARIAHLLLHDHLDRLAAGRALHRIRERDLTVVRRLADGDPGRRRLVDPEPRQRVPVVTDAEAGEAGADPAPVAIPEHLAAQLGRDAARAEQLGMAADDPGIDDPPGGGVLAEFGAAPAEDDVDPPPPVGPGKRPAPPPAPPPRPP